MSEEMKTQAVNESQDPVRSHENPNPYIKSESSKKYNDTWLGGALASGIIALMCFLFELRVVCYVAVGFIPFSIIAHYLHGIREALQKIAKHL